MVVNEQRRARFPCCVGGGMGRTPVIGKLLREFLPRKHLLSYLEAILRIYNLLGRRDNIHKARIKILVNRRGDRAFRSGSTRVAAYGRRLLSTEDDEIAPCSAFSTRRLRDSSAAATPASNSTCATAPSLRCGTSAIPRRTRCPAIASSMFP